MKIKVVHKKVGQRPQVVEIDHQDLPAMQSMVQGLIDVIQWEYPLMLVVNEEGLYSGDTRPNLRFENNQTLNLVNSAIYGDVFMTAQGKDGDFRTLTDKEIQKAIVLLEEYAISYRERV